MSTKKVFDYLKKMKEYDTYKLQTGSLQNDYNSIFHIHESKNIHQ